MGVMGTLAVYENNRFHAKQRSICAYCEGTGIIKGASYQSSSGEWLKKADSVCINCEGTGLSIPATLDRKGIKQQDDELETKLDEIGIAALADDIVRAENSPGDMLEVTRMLQRRALARGRGRRGGDGRSPRPRRCSTRCTPARCASRRRAAAAPRAAGSATFAVAKAPAETSGRGARASPQRGPSAVRRRKRRPRARPRALRPHAR